MVNAFDIKVAPERLQCPLVTLSLCTVLVAHVGGGVLVDAVVSEVGEHISNFGALVAVFVGREPDKAIIIQVDSERVDTGHQHVEAQIKFRVVNEIGPGDISLNNEGAGLRNLAPLVHHLDSTTTSHRGRFDNPPSLASFSLPDLP